MKLRPCRSYNDCPTMILLPSGNLFIMPYECHCNPRWYRLLYRHLIYPIGSRIFGWYDQEVVMRKIEKA